MDHLRNRLHEARKQNVDGKWYVPRHAIDEITDRGTISQIVRDNNLSYDESDPIYAKSQQRDLEENILAQAKAAFAVACYVKRNCVRYVPRLINHAARKGRTADNYLPFFTQRELRDCGFGNEDADVFLATRWHFTAPDIRLGIVSPVVYESEIILPFQHPERGQRRPPDTGAFGTVIEIRVDEGHQSEPTYKSRVRTVESEFASLLLAHDLNRSCESNFTLTLRRKRPRGSFGTSAYCLRHDTKTFFNFCLPTGKVTASISFSLWQATEP